MFLFDTAVCKKEVMIVVLIVILAHSIMKKRDFYIILIAERIISVDFLTSRIGKMRENESFSHTKVFFKSQILLMYAV